MRAFVPVSSNNVRISASFLASIAGATVAAEGVPDCLAVCVAVLAASCVASGSPPDQQISTSANIVSMIPPPNVFSDQYCGLLWLAAKYSFPPSPEVHPGFGTGGVKRKGPSLQLDDAANSGDNT